MFVFTFLRRKRKNWRNGDREAIGTRKPEERHQILCHEAGLGPDTLGP